MHRFVHLVVGETHERNSGLCRFGDGREQESSLSPRRPRPSMLEPPVPLRPRIRTDAAIDVAAKVEMAKGKPAAPGGASSARGAQSRVLFAERDGMHARPSARADRDGMHARPSARADREQRAFQTRLSVERAAHAKQDRENEQMRRALREDMPDLVPRTPFGHLVPRPPTPPLPRRSQVGGDESASAWPWGSPSSGPDAKGRAFFNEHLGRGHRKRVAMTRNLMLLESVAGPARSLDPKQLKEAVAADPLLSHLSLAPEPTITSPARRDVPPSVRAHTLLDTPRQTFPRPLGGPGAAASAAAQQLDPTAMHVVARGSPSRVRVAAALHAPSTTNASVSAPRQAAVQGSYSPRRKKVRFGHGQPSSKDDDGHEPTTEGSKVAFTLPILDWHTVQWPGEQSADKPAPRPLTPYAGAVPLGGAARDRKGAGSRLSEGDLLRQPILIDDADPGPAEGTNDVNGGDDDETEAVDVLMRRLRPPGYGKKTGKAHAFELNSKAQKSAKRRALTRALLQDSEQARAAAFAAQAAARKRREAAAPRPERDAASEQILVPDLRKRAAAIAKHVQMDWQVGEIHEWNPVVPPLRQEEHDASPVAVRRANVGGSYAVRVDM